MDHIVTLLAQYGLLAVFVAVLADESGLPSASPVVVMTAAAYSTRTPLAIMGVLAAAMAGGMLADFGWFLTAKKHGRRLLAFACRFSSSPDSCVLQTNGMYQKYGNISLVASKFIPGMGVIAIALAGAADLSSTVFASYTALGLLLLHGTFVALGVIFHSAVSQVIQTLSHLGPYGLAIIAAVVVGYVAFRYLRHQAFIRSLKMARISVEELAHLMDDGETLVLVDVRHAVQRAAGIIPGALYASPAEAKESLAHLSRDTEIVVYCSCPNEISAATAARHLRGSGFKKIRPLEGGYNAWLEAGREVHKA